MQYWFHGCKNRNVLASAFLIAVSDCGPCPARSINAHAQLSQSAAPGDHTALYIVSESNGISGVPDVS